VSHNVWPAAILDKLKNKSMLHMMAVLEQEGPTFVERPLVSLLGGHDKRLVYEGEKTMPLREAVRTYFLGSGDLPSVHRVALFDGGGTIDTIISQMDIVRYVHAHLQDSPWCQETLADSGACALSRSIRPQLSEQLSMQRVCSVQRGLVWSLFF
jgi:hypothetical protein